MKVVLLRVGTDSGCRPIHTCGPLLPDGRFELVPIPDHSARGEEERTYGNTLGRHGRPLVDYFPERCTVIADFPLHVDPEFDTYTYGTPTRLQKRLARLEAGDMLVFYGGLRAVSEEGVPLPNTSHALYLFGYFEVACAVRARDQTREQLLPTFGGNFHVRHAELFEEQRNDLVLVKGSSDSRLLRNAMPISGIGRDRSGRPLFVLSEEMRPVFGMFSDVGSIQHRVLRWVDPSFVDSASAFARSLT